MLSVFYSGAGPGLRAPLQTHLSNDAILYCKPNKTRRTIKGVSMTGPTNHVDRIPEENMSLSRTCLA